MHRDADRPPESRPSAFPLLFSEYNNTDGIAMLREVSRSKTKPLLALEPVFLYTGGVLNDLWLGWLELL